MGMSKEEAIQIFNEVLLFGKAQCTQAEFKELTKMSIKALEQESTTKKDLVVDAISRADVLKLMQDNWHTHNGDWAMQESMDDIRALPSVTSQEPCKDCISRNTVLTLINDVKNANGFSKYTQYEYLFDQVDTMPAVTPIRPKGHWISHGEHCKNLGVMPSGLGAYEWCSNCDCGIDVKEWYRSRYNYCPNCGADMSEVEE